MGSKVIWTPLPGSQSLAMRWRSGHILLHGPRGSGKTDVQLMLFRRWVGQGFGEHWRGIIFGRHYKDLDDIVAKSQRWFSRFGDGAKFKASVGDYRWVWPTGEELLFRQLAKPGDYAGYHGHEYPFIGHNELTQYATCEPYDLMMSTNRSGYVPTAGQPEIPLMVVSTTNPWGPGHTWVKSRFIHAGKPGEIVRATARVFNPRTQQEEDVVRTQTHLFGHWRENRYLSPQYIAELQAISDPNRRKAWYDGIWDIVGGTAFDGVWGQHVIVPRFKIPVGWRVDRALDWGSSHPFSIGWWAEANGEAAKLTDGKQWCPARGSLIRLHEWYGTEKLGTNRGLQMGARDVARGIREREDALMDRDAAWVRGRPSPGPADTEIFSHGDNPSNDSIAKQMAGLGVDWTEADKRPGSRKTRLQLMRDRMLASRTGDGPGLYVMEHCRAWRELVPTIPRSESNPDDVDSDAEDHIYDESGYRVLGSGIVGLSHPIRIEMAG